jgi:hypothetical protein
MFGKFRQPKPQVTTSQETGEMSVTKPEPKMPALQNHRRVSELAGVQVPHINLKDSPELDGQEIAIVFVAIAAGEFGEYCKIGAFLVDNGEARPNPVVIMTGAENVLNRALAVQDYASMETPVLGVLKRAGDAWLLD